jgi:acyl-CoA synthetase (AMP-forming)/AMP-acid ligase II
MSVHWPIFRQLLRRPFRTFIVDDRRSFRGIDLLAGSLFAAEAIAARSKTKNVAIMLPTTGAFPIAALAAWGLGKTVVPLNYLLKPEELKFILDDCGADTVVTVGPMLEYLQTAHKDEPVDEHGVPEWLRGTGVLRLDTLDYKSVPEFRLPALASDDDLALLRHER